jgi:hypothetical protein
MAKALKILLADDPIPMDRRAAEPNARRPANMRPCRNNLLDSSGSAAKLRSILRLRAAPQGFRS